ncbi:MAG: hypothetical protein JW932_08025 [Deltaproteobacteria bacterium]|nr:hypothetical protein [Deltaproteobacteria bacterium]
MIAADAPPKEAFRKEDPFGIIEPNEFDDLGIDPSDIPPGTYAAQKHPPQLPSRFGGNAYGFGFFEIYDHLDRKDIETLQSIQFDNPDQIKRNYQEINGIYKKIGLLIRFSSQGKPFYLIPFHLVSTTITNIRNKANEISKIIHFHRKKYMKEDQKIGLITYSGDPIINDLSIRFKEHEFIIIDSLAKFQSIKTALDLIIIARDIYRIIAMGTFIHQQGDMLSKKQFEIYASYILGKVYKVLKPDGEVFIIANAQPLKTNQTAKVTFKTIKEQKDFLLFSHIFKTRKRYQITGSSLRINCYDFQKYLSGVYVEQEVINELLGDLTLEAMGIKEIDALPYLNYPLNDEFTYDQNKIWPKLFSIYFDEIFHKPLIPDTVKAEWKRRFSVKDYSPDYMFIYMAQKKPCQIRLPDFINDVMESQLAGCPLPLLADYKNSCDYVLRILNILKNIRDDHDTSLSEVFMERIREPLVNKRRRYEALNDVLKLISKINRIEMVQAYLNPDHIEGPVTRLIENLEILPFFGFSYGELKEILLIIVGHTTLGRILSGKMNEKTLKPVSDLARSYEIYEAIGFLRYCRLMSLAETMASKQMGMHQNQLQELFDLFDTMVKIVTSRDLDWDWFLDEKIAQMGGVHNKIIRKILMMKDQFEFIDNWMELPKKGEKEKESLADYDHEKLAQIEDIIQLIAVIGEFENRFLKDDPLELPIFYRKFLNMEFHGTGHLFERMDGRLVFILLWITVNVCQGEIINFNPILTDIKYKEFDSHVNKVESEARFINTEHLNLNILKELSKQLYESNSAFIANTGFRLTFNKEIQSVDVSYIDMDENIDQLDTLGRRARGFKVSEIPIENLRIMERRFADLEDFHKGHIRFKSGKSAHFGVPSRPVKWFKKAISLRHYLKTNIREVIFVPEHIYDDLNLLCQHAPTILLFVLPEFMALRDLKLTGKIYLRSPIIEHILTSLRKIQALINKDRKAFQDVKMLHKLAQREFGPMVADIVGLNETQLDALENIIDQIRTKTPVFEAMVKSFIFQDLGLTPAFRRKYMTHINPTDQAQAGAIFLEKEKIPQKYQMSDEVRGYLIFLVKHHDRIHHIARGEFTIQSLQEIIDTGDKLLFDAFFVSSFVMFAAMGEDLVYEDLANRLFQIRTLCHRIMDGKTSFKAYYDDFYIEKGHQFYALEEYQQKGLPEGLRPAEYLESHQKDILPDAQYIRGGKKVLAIVRIFRLKGIRYVDFLDLVNLIVKVPIPFIYKKKKYYGIGYTTFEKEIYEAFRIYNVIRRLPEPISQFMFDLLIEDKVRIFGFENVNIFLNYENMIKLLLIALLGSKRLKDNQEMICLDFLQLVEKIGKRYEAVNDALNQISIESIWRNKSSLNQLFKTKTGLVLQKDESRRRLVIDFIDKINIPQKISHMENITDIDQLKNYYHSSLQSLRNNPFHTDDYELELELVFERRSREIIDMILEQAKKQMELLKDFGEVDHVYNDLMDRALELGFSEDQKHRLNDLFELRKDNLKREKLMEIHGLIDQISDVNELNDYWDGIKWYLLSNRQFVGKEFEHLVAKSFDEALHRMDS